MDSILGIPENTKDIRKRFEPSLMHLILSPKDSTIDGPHIRQSYIINI